MSIKVTAAMVASLETQNINDNYPRSKAQSVQTCLARGERANLI